jgi:hypothetical protein
LLWYGRATTTHSTFTRNPSPASTFAETFAILANGATTTLGAVTATTLVHEFDTRRPSQFLLLSLFGANGPQFSFQFCPFCLSSVFQERLSPPAHLRRAKDEGKRLGRPRIAPELEKRIQTALNQRKRTGEGVRGIAKRFGVDPSTVQRISRPFAVAAA